MCVCQATSNIGLNATISNTLIRFKVASSIYPISQDAEFRRLFGRILLSSIYVIFENRHFISDVPQMCTNPVSVRDDFLPVRDSFYGRVAISTALVSRPAMFYGVTNFLGGRG